ncbi:MAG TPA: hypothetical protein GX696_10915, partial [Pseudomonadaceae bacterium]|nr:hypothetical protein [Pseudomonadaceae bacterium]
LDVTFIPDVNPDSVPLQFPPREPAYATDWSSWSLWRWLETHSYDAVIIMGGDAFGFGEALASGASALGNVPVFEFDYEAELIDALKGQKQLRRSPASESMQLRMQRDETELAAELSSVYGQSVTDLTYIPAMALIARLRLGEEAAVRELADSLLADPQTLRLDSSLHIAGHLLFAELAEFTGESRYLEQARIAADLGFAADGSLLEAMPHHGEYSDAIFMATPLLAKVGKLSGEQRYFDLAQQHVEFILSRLERADGLYNHWPRADAAWGRGNAFVLLGLALALSDFPESHPGHAALLEHYRSLATVLLRYLDADGMWHNVINIPGSWAETSATAMIATALQRGVDQAWLPAFYQGVVDASWQGILARTSNAGSFSNVCESTPGQVSLEAYLARRALSAVDARAGGMVLNLIAERLAR